MVLIIDIVIHDIEGPTKEIAFMKREDGFCSQVLLDDKIMVVPDPELVSYRFYNP